MKSMHPTVTLGLIFTMLFATAVSAAPSADEAQQDAQAGRISIAVYDFVISGGDDAELAGQLGDMIADVLSISLSGNDAFRVVDRKSLAATLGEHQISLSGITDPQDAVKAGKLAGAQLIVMGKLMEVGQSRMLAVKVIGTETTLMRGTLVRGKLNAAVDEMMLEAATKVAEVIDENGKSLLAKAEGVDRAAELIAELEGRKLPVMAVIIPERHMGRPRNAQAPDPAVETEIKKLLLEAGAELRDAPGNELADWVASYRQGGGATWPQTLEGVDYVVVGEGLSESGGRLGGLQIAVARAEINMISRTEGKIVVADRVTARGVDLSEQIAAKSSLQNAGHKLGTAVLAHLVKVTKPAEAEAEQD